MSKEPSAPARPVHCATEPRYLCRASPLCVENVGYTVAGEGLVYPLNLTESAFLHELATTARI